MADTLFGKDLTVDDKKELDNLSSRVNARLESLGDAVEESRKRQEEYFTPKSLLQLDASTRKNLFVLWLVICVVFYEPFQQSVKAFVDRLFSSIGGCNNVVLLVVQSAVIVVLTHVVTTYLQ